MNHCIYTGAVGENRKYIYKGKLFSKLSDLKKETFTIEMDELGTKELLTFKYPIGSRTIFKDVIEIPAGVFFDIENKKIVREKVFRYGKKRRRTTQELIDLIYRIFDKKKNKYLKYEAIVIPLSGGFDSRLISFMLKELNLNNVIAVTYGQRYLEEVNVSRTVAKRLKVDWIFVEYTEKLIKEALKLLGEFSLYSKNISTTPHIQDFIAFYYLHKNSLIPRKSIIIPGHSGDFLAGSRLKYTKNIRTFYSLFKSVLGYHSQVFPVPKEVRISLRKYLLYLLNTYSLDYSDLFEVFDWRERQTKYIANSVAVYEFFGYDWDLPLWDSEIFDFFSTLDNTLRYNENLYKSSLNKIFEKYNINIPGIDTGTSTVREWFKKFVKPSIIEYAKLIESLIKKKHRFNKLYGNFDFRTICNEENRYIPIEINFYISMFHLLNIRRNWM